MATDTPPAAEIFRAGSPALVYDSPHSGRFYPDDFALGAPLADVRRGEDACVDELLMPSVAAGAVLLRNNYPRCYIDVNRDATDIDPALLSEPWPGELAPTEKSRRGLGLIRRLVVPGIEAQGKKLSVAEVRARIATVYEPYHAALDQLIEEMRNARGVVHHVNWHSMKSVGNAMTPDGAGAVRPDFVVSDGHGTTASAAVTDTIVRLLREQGYRVAVNDPYVGGPIVRRIGNPAKGIHSVQVEINRGLYLDEARVEMTEAASRLSEALRRFTIELASALVSRQRP